MGENYPSIPTTGLLGLDFNDPATYLVAISKSILRKRAAKLAKMKAERDGERDDEDDDNHEQGLGQDSDEAGRFLRTSTPPTLNRLTKRRSRHESGCLFSRKYW